MSTSSQVLTCVAPGDLVSTSTKTFREAIDQALAAEARNPLLTTLELDLRAAQFIDSVGINMIILCIRKMQDRNGRVRLLIGNSNLKRVLTFMRVDQHAEIVLVV